MSEQRIYIAGPISHLPVAEVKKAFKDAEWMLRRQGYVTINPMDYAPLYRRSALSYDSIMDIDLTLLRQCECVYFLRGWKESKGAQMEMAEAVRLDKEIIMQSNV